MAICCDHVVGVATVDLSPNLDLLGSNFQVRGSACPSP